MHNYAKKIPGPHEVEPGIRAGVAFSFLSDRPNARFRGLASTIVLDGTLVSGIGTEGSRG